MYSPPCIIPLSFYHFLSHIFRSLLLICLHSCAFLHPAIPRFSRPFFATPASRPYASSPGARLPNKSVLTHFPPHIPYIFQDVYCLKTACRHRHFFPIADLSSDLIFFRYRPLRFFTVSRTPPYSESAYITLNSLLYDSEIVPRSVTPVHLSIVSQLSLLMEPLPVF